MTADILSEQLKRLPTRPGVYLFKDSEGNILYVGKAANLHNRVNSYFQDSRNLPEKLNRMVSRVADLDFYVTSSEQEALILELNMIKRHHPHYNVRLRDDKTFPYLKITTNEEWPRICITRRPEQDGARYFGPFASAWSVRQTLRTIKRIFPFRSCNKSITCKDSRACLWYYLGNCLAPCIGAVSRQEYAKAVKEIIFFLEGKREKIVKELEAGMNEAAEALQFEKAALLRDRVRAIQEVIEGQKIAAKVRGEQDVIAFVMNRDEAYVQVFFIRRGKLIGRESFILQGTRSETPVQIMTSFVKQFYNSSAYIPPLVLLQYPVEDVDFIEGWLQARRKGKVKIQVPSRGGKKQLVDIVTENARQGWEQHKIKAMASPGILETALEEVEKELKLPSTPTRIEGYDISDIMGTSAVGSMVVFEKGKPKQSQYRRFRIKTVAGADDYAMLQEVLRRRFKRFTQPLEAGPDTWTIPPDLVLVDGGKGQLNAALEAIKEMEINVPVASLAKENEEIFLPGKAKPVVLPRSSPGLQLLERVRDEAHRFAIGYFQRVHKKEAFVSVLDSIPGIGSRRKRALLRAFGSIDAIKQASEEELAAVKGMTRSMAKKMKESFLREV